MPRTHQFLITLMVHTTKLKPATTPAFTSTRSTTNGRPVVTIQRDGQQKQPASKLIGVNS
ncbi:hypothetical protein [Mycobacterium intracellulare]|uniref:hypothetical protein n=1 Tax=Mycobacterium intracellulare TaxID=1767 RepID=UPI00115A6ACA|nr:hypothetical protein [Mycobacterium intracellulare]